MLTFPGLEVKLLGGVTIQSFANCMLPTHGSACTVQVKHASQDCATKAANGLLGPCQQ